MSSLEHMSIWKLLPGIQKTEYTHISKFGEEKKLMA